MADVIRLGSIFGHTGGSFAGLVYHPGGLAPTINTAQGGLRMPLIIEEQDGKNKNQTSDQAWIYRNDTWRSSGF